MAASAVGAQASERMRRLAREFDTASTKAVSKAALEAKRVHLDELTSVAPGGRLRNVGRSGAKLGVRYDVKGTRNPVAMLRATGPWHLIENAIKAHDIRPRRRRAGAKAVVTPDGPRASVHHPGVRARRHPWRRGLDRARPLVRKAVEGTYSDAFKRGLR